MGRLPGRLVQGATALAIIWLFVLPVGVIVLSSLAGRWSGTVLPAGLTLRWFERLGQADWQSVLTSLEVGLAVAAAGTALGLWLALALEGRDRLGLGAVVDLLAMAPSAVPSVVVGLAVLEAYHKAPLDLSRSSAIVVFAQLTLVLPYSYRVAASALGPELTRLREAAATLGASPAEVLLRIVLPQVMPALKASFALSFALSLGELGATLTVYPPGFATTPIVVVGEVERGFYLPASALSVVLLSLAFVALTAIAWPKAARPSGRGAPGRPARPPDPSATS